MIGEKLSEEQRIQVAEEYSKGIHTKIISEKYGISRITIERISNVYGKERPWGKPNRLTEEQKDNLIIDYNNGMDKNLISKKYNITDGGISYIILHRNPKIKILTNEQNTKLLEDYKNGLHINDLSNKYKASQTYIYTLARKNNIIRPILNTH